MGFVARRDLDETAARLTGWIRSQLPVDASDVGLSNFSAPGNGFSNETLLFDLHYAQGSQARRERLVARLGPTDLQVFPDYDLGLQVRVMRKLADSGIPVPVVRWEEPDPALLGTRFYVMEHIEGVIPPDNPPYHNSGVCAEMSAESRAAIWWDGLDVLSRIHRLDWRASGFDFLDRPQQGATPIAQQLDYYVDYLRWAARGVEQPLCEAALRWLVENQPRDEPVALCWGDARLPNMIFRNDCCVAVLDWEMATLGNPEQDLAWWLFLDWHHSSGIGGLPRLEGFPGREESVERYAQLLGRELLHLHYYEVFAAMRFAVIMIRLAQQLEALSLPTPVPDFERNNPCTHRIAELLDLPRPGPRIGEV